MLNGLTPPESKVNNTHSWYTMIYLSTLFVWKNFAWIFEVVSPAFKPAWCLWLFLTFRKCRGGYPYLEDPRANARILCIARDALQSLAHGLLGGRYINLLVPLRSRFKYQKVHPFRYIYIWYMIYVYIIYNVYIVCVYIYILYVCIYFSLDDRCPCRVFDSRS